MRGPMNASGCAKRCPLTQLALATLLAALCLRAGAAETWRARVSPRLLALYDAAARGPAPAPTSTPSAGASPLAPHVDAAGRVEVDVYYDCAQRAPLDALASAGLSTGASVHVPPLCVVEGWIAPAQIARLASVAGVTRVELPRYALHPRTKAQSAATATTSGIDGNGLAIMRANQFVSQTGTSGAGVTVGVQSTGVTSLQLIQERGELPRVQVLTPSGEATPPVADEGTVLLEEIHAVAPGAGLAFCGPETFVEYTSCLQELIGAGATILVDDVVFLGSDFMSQSDPDTQAVEQVLLANPSVALFTVVGNYNGSYWEGAYTPVSLASQSLPALTCPSGSGTQTDAYVAEFNDTPSEQLTVTEDGTYPLMFAWGDPASQNASRFDVYWSSSAGSGASGCISTASTNGNSVTQSVTLTAGTYTLTVATPDASLAGKFLKLWIGGDGLTFLSATSSGAVVSAQAFAPDAITIGAVNGSDGVGNDIESFSSLGPLSLLFPTPAKVQVPALVAPDGIYVDAAGTYFADLLFPDGNFYGTSASVPNAGAVAALLRGAFPSLTAAQLAAALEAGAVPLGSGAPNGTFGFGRIDALGALATLPAPTLSALPASTIDAGATSPAYAFTVSGTGRLHFTVATSNALLIPAVIGAAGSPGISIGPAGCGITVSSCTLTVTAAAGTGGTADVTLYAVDGANRSAPAQMAVTINGAPTSSNGAPASSGSSASTSPAEPVTVSPSANGGGGTFGFAEMVSLAALAAARCRRRLR